MTCHIQLHRSTTTVEFTTDTQLLEMAGWYAVRHHVTFSELVTSALVTALADGLVPGPFLVCDEHHAVAEWNSSGTAAACPVAQGERGFILE